MGAYDVIAALVPVPLQNARTTPRLAPFATGASPDSHKRAQHPPVCPPWRLAGIIGQLTVEQLCALAGGPCIYLGRDMKTSHAGLGITEAEWEANMQLLGASLDKFRISPKEKHEVLALFAAYKDDIVERDKAWFTTLSEKVIRRSNSRPISFA